jgi:hypothetical protein
LEVKIQILKIGQRKISTNFFVPASVSTTAHHLEATPATRTTDFSNTLKTTGDEVQVLVDSSVGPLSASRPQLDVQRIQASCCLAYRATDRYVVSLPPSHMPFSPETSLDVEVTQVQPSEFSPGEAVGKLPSPSKDDKLSEVRLRVAALSHPIVSTHYFSSRARWSS